MELDLDQALPILERTPSLLDGWLRGLPEEWTTPNEGPDSWSAFDIVGHLIDGEENDWIARARIILSGDPSRTFTPFDRFRHLARNRGKRLDDLLDELAALRRANLETLRGLHLARADLERRANHPSFGPVTLKQLLATWVVHDLGHIAQIARVMAKQYAAAVGPWQEYLPVLHRGPGGK
jgi:hypothetical protein